MKGFIVAVVGLGLLAVPAESLAKTNTLTGKFIGDPNGSVTLKIKTNKSGVATKVTSVSYKNANFSCLSDSGPESGERSGSLSGSAKIVKVKEGSKTKYSINFQTTSGGSLSGYVNKKGTKVTGGDVRDRFKSSTGKTCEAQGDFSASK